MCPAMITLLIGCLLASPSLISYHVPCDWNGRLNDRHLILQQPGYKYLLILSVSPMCPAMITLLIGCLLASPSLISYHVPCDWNGRLNDRHLILQQPGYKHLLILSVSPMCPAMITLLIGCLLASPSLISYHVPCDWNGRLNDRHLILQQPGEKSSPKIPMK